MIVDAASIIDRINSTLRDEAKLLVADADIIEFINDAQLDICTETECLQTFLSTSTIAGSPSYELPADFLKFKWVTYDTRLLEFTTRDKLSIESHGWERNWETTMGVPSKYFYEFGDIRIYPNPNKVASLKIGYIAKAENLTAAADLLTVPNIFKRCVLKYCLARAKEQAKSFREAELYWAQYNQELSISTYEFQVPVTESYPSVRAVSGDDWY